MYHLDILPLYRTISNNLFKISLVSLIFFAVGFGAAILRSQSYRAEVLILPPSEKDLKGMILAQIPLNRADSPEIYDLLSHSSIFRKYKMNLASRTTQLDFLKQQGTVLLNDVDFVPIYSRTSSDGFAKRNRGRDFAALFTTWRLSKDKIFHWPMLGYGDPFISFGVESDRTSGRPYLTLSVAWRNPKIAAEIANQYAQYVNTQTVTEVQDLLIAGLDIRASNIQDMLSYQRKKADRVIEDHLYELEEAIQIAKDLGLKEPTDAFGNFNIVNINPPAKFFSDPNSELRPYSPSTGQKHLPLYHPGNIAQSTVFSDKLASMPPLYARGWEALEKERDALARRPSNDIFIPNIRDLQGQLDWIQSIEPDAVVFNAAQITHPALPPTSTTNHSNITVALLAALFGFIVSTTWVATRAIQSLPPQ